MSETCVPKKHRDASGAMEDTILGIDTTLGRILSVVSSIALLFASLCFLRKFLEIRKFHFGFDPYAMCATYQVQYEFCLISYICKGAFIAFNYRYYPAVVQVPWYRSCRVLLAAFTK